MPLILHSRGGSVCCLERNQVQLQQTYQDQGKRMKPENPFPKRETARLKLRKPFRKDARLLLKVSQNPAVMQYYGMAAYKNLAEALGEIEWFNQIFVQSEGIRWIITEKGADAYIGDIGFHNFVRQHARAELGFKLAQAFWGRGLMAEALAEALAYGFSVMQLNRIEAVVDPSNLRCLGLLKKAGFIEEGLLRDYELEETGFVDLVMLSLLKKEYRP